MIEAQEKVLPLYSHCGEHVGTISLARALRGAESGEVELRRKGSGRKSRITAAWRKLIRPYRPARTITVTEVENNALDYQGAMLSPTDSIHAIQRAVAKVRVWPEIHDHKSPTVSAGVAIGVFCQYPPAEERYITFA